MRHPSLSSKPMKRALVIVLLSLAVHESGAQAPADRFLARARALHRAVPMIDTHNDLPEMLRERAKNDLSRMNPEQPLDSIDTDFPRMKKGLVGGQFWAAYVPASFVEHGGATYALEQIDVIHRMINQSPSLGYATTSFGFHVSSKSLRSRAERRSTRAPACAAAATSARSTAPR